MSTAAAGLYSAAEYLAFERKSEEKHAFFNGEIFAMSGGAAQHNLIAMNLASELRSALWRGPCRVHTSDLRICSPNGLYTYADVSVVCSKPQYQDSKQDVLLNPLVIIEVLSPSTERYDRSNKFKLYQSISTLSEYVLVSQNATTIPWPPRSAGSSGVKLDLGVDFGNGKLALQLLTTISDAQGVVRFPAAPRIEHFARQQDSEHWRVMSRSAAWRGQRASRTRSGFRTNSASGWQGLEHCETPTFVHRGFPAVQTRPPQTRF